MGPGALVYRSSPSEVRRWRAAHLGIGLPLVLVGLLSLWAALAGGLSAGGGDGAGGGGGTTMVLVLYVAVGAVILAFGLRYALLGLRGRGIVLYERAVEADFPGRWFVIPERRLEGLVRVRVEGTPKATSAYAIAASGHAVTLPPSFVGRTDLWRLGALGNRPVAPGGKAAARLAKGATAATAEADLLVDLEERRAGTTAAPSTVTAPAMRRPAMPEAPAPLAPSRPSPARSPRPSPPPPLPPPPAPLAPSPAAPSALPDEGAMLELEPIEAPPPRPSPPQPSPPPTPPPPPPPREGTGIDAGFELEPIGAAPEPAPAAPAPHPPSTEPRPPASGPRVSDWEEVKAPRG